MAALARRTGLPARVFRYAVLHGIAPGVPASGRGRGFARRFGCDQSFLIAAAAALLHAGLRSGVVRACVALLAEASTVSPTVRGLDVADGRYARVRTPRRAGPWQPLMSADQKNAPHAIRRLVVVQLDVHRLRRLLER